MYLFELRTGAKSAIDDCLPVMTASSDIIRIISCQCTVRLDCEESYYLEVCARRKLPVRLSVLVNWIWTGQCSGLAHG